MRASGYFLNNNKHIPSREVTFHGDGYIRSKEEPAHPEDYCIYPCITCANV